MFCRANVQNYTYDLRTTIVFFPTFLLNKEYFSQFSVIRGSVDMVHVVVLLQSVLYKSQFTFDITPLIVASGSKRQGCLVPLI